MQIGRRWCFIFSANLCLLRNMITAGRAHPPEEHCGLDYG